MQTLTQDETRAHLTGLIAISADVSDWGEAQFLKDLPRKWDLSFRSGTDAYCILSERHGAIHINQLMVRLGHRGSGLGSAMLAEAVRRGAQTLKVHPDNTGARRCYERHGWIETARENGYAVYVLGPTRPLQDLAEGLGELGERGQSLFGDQATHLPGGSVENGWADRVGG